MDGGSLGKIIEAEFHFDRYKPELSPKQHKETALPGSGLLHDLGPHLIDQALYLFGMPASIFGYTKITRPGSAVNDYFDIQLFYPDITVRLKSSLLVKEALPGFIVHGSNGSFIKERADIQEDILKMGEKPGTESWGTEPKEAAGVLNIQKDGKDLRENIISDKGNYMEFFEGLHQAITNNKPLPVAGEDGLRVMKIIDAVIKSNEEGTVVKLQQ